MIFRNIIFSAVIVGVLVGIIYGLFQQYQISPIIYAAEEFEVVEEETTGTLHVHDDGHAHHHDAEAWGPEDGSERIFWTMFSNVMTAISFALIMIALMALHNYKSSKPKIDAIRGIVWGIVGMLSLFVAPALFGLHPEVPGTIAAELENRQAWWLFCAFATMGGVAVLYYAPLKIKAVGLLVIAAPHILGPPLPDSHGFANTSPEAVAALTELTSEFYSMTTIGMALFFVLLGACCGYAVQRFVKLDQAPIEAA